jgi:thiamine-phosphate pyrophosphorylase
LIGYSAHSIEEALLAEAAGADFVTFGPVYYTPSKAVYGPPVGIEKLKAVCSALSIPVYALGGITVGNILEAINTGTAGIALISAIMAAPDPVAAATTLLQLIDQHALCSGSTHT